MNSTNVVNDYYTQYLNRSNFIWSIPIGLSFIFLYKLTSKSSYFNNKNVNKTGIIICAIVCITICFVIYNLGGQTNTKKDDQDKTPKPDPAPDPKPDPKPEPKPDIKADNQADPNFFVKAFNFIKTTFIKIFTNPVTIVLLIIVGIGAIVATLMLSGKFPNAAHHIKSALNIIYNHIKTGLQKLQEILRRNLVIGIICSIIVMIVFILAIYFIFF